MEENDSMQTIGTSINNNEDTDLSLKITDDSVMFLSHLHYEAQSMANNSEDQNRRKKDTHFTSSPGTNRMLLEIQGSAMAILFMAFDVI